MALKASITTDFPAWYQEVLTKAQLSENGPVRGTIVIRPYAYAIWELMQADMDRRIKSTGAENAYFPLFIPESYLRREASHIEGFSPELAVVTHAGGKKLEEPFVVRPTSETIIGEFMSKWIDSYRDLPLLLNQWANVVRWEKRPRAFLRTTEFLWQEGHTAHADEADAAAYALRILNDVYRAFLVETLAVPVIRGQKSVGERFAGAINTMTCEGMMGDGKALQMATSHELGTNFAKVFNVSFKTSAGLQETAWTTSWGSSTRMMGGLFMAHGDQKGLRLPPAIAPYQVVIVQVSDEASIADKVGELESSLRKLGVRVRVDRDTVRSIGARITDWDIKGVPLRVDLGSREIADGVLSISRRDTGEKFSISAESFVARAIELLDNIQDTLLAQATTVRETRTADVSSVQEAREQAETGFARIPWSVLGETGEAELQAAAVSVRCLTMPDGSVPDESELPESIAVAARAY